LAYFQQLIDGLHWCHVQKVCHRTLRILLGRLSLCVCMYAFTCAVHKLPIMRGSVFLKSPSDMHVCRFFYSLFSGDLKPDNILLSYPEFQLKIADFGMTIEWDGSHVVFHFARHLMKLAAFPQLFSPSQVVFENSIDVAVFFLFLRHHPI
jgi:serine/threonine protein kinase